jgi:hypothetical protein
LVSILVVAVAVGIILIAAYTVCLFLAARWLTQYRNRTFVYVIAALSCLAIPYGTLLGIFTFMVFARPACKDFFAPRDISQAAQPLAATEQNQPI